MHFFNPHAMKKEKRLEIINLPFDHCSLLRHRLRDITLV